MLDGQMCIRDSLKLALRNIRRSVRDYAVYFITLLFGVAVFYAFNSIGSQQILFDMETSASRSVFDSTTYILGMFSVVVACVLGFLILYANQFLIRRRKREFGTYLVLGMTPGHVSRIVLYETVLVGLLSLAVGLICGAVSYTHLLEVATCRRPRKGRHVFSTILPHFSPSQRNLRDS